MSENPADELNLVFNRFNLGNLNGITEASGYNLGGILKWQCLCDQCFMPIPSLPAYLNIDSLIINHEMLGNAEINSIWDDDRKHWM